MTNVVVTNENSEWLPGKEPAVTNEMVALKGGSNVTDSIATSVVRTTGVGYID